MSDAYEHMKRIQAQQEQRAAERAEIIRRAEVANENKLAKILSDLMEILRIEGMRPLPVYEDLGVKAHGLLRMPRQHYQVTTALAWSLGPADWNIDDPVGIPTVTTAGELISTISLPISTSPEMPTKGINHGPGLQKFEIRKNLSMPYYYGKLGRKKQLCDLDDDERSEYFIEVVKEYKRLLDWLLR
ncbi:hypothetical protein ACTD5D_41390 [Nocardia takedensis]|uniref:hypothetical protein n=1 Tax=Nocardia takedensis TaxID=259390 RepID=UPI003F777DC2